MYKSKRISSSSWPLNWPQKQPHNLQLWPTHQRNGYLLCAVQKHPFLLLPLPDIISTQTLQSTDNCLCTNCWQYNGYRTCTTDRVSFRVHCGCFSNFSVRSQQFVTFRLRKASGLLARMTVNNDPCCWRNVIKTGVGKERTHWPLGTIHSSLDDMTPAEMRAFFTIGSWT